MEVAFSVIRVLAVARLLWPARPALSLENLASIIDAPVEQIGVAVALLCDDGMVALHPGDGRALLSDGAAGDLLHAALH